MGEPAWSRLGYGDLAGAINVVVSLGFCAWTRRSTREPTFLIRAGLWYMFFICLSIAVIWHLAPFMRPVAIGPMITWVGVVVLNFAAILPIEPRTIVVAGLCCVSMNPAAMLFMKLAGIWDYGSLAKIVLMHYPDYLLVVVAGSISSVVTRLGQQVSRAQEMGSYHLGKLIGKGGMGEVYHATHRMLQRKAAIKLIRTENVTGGDHEATTVAVARFRREAEVAASLRSPHTVALYDFGTTPDGALYIVMECLEGMDLERLVRAEGAQPWPRVVHILRQACESLEEAHQRGLVHRDIKPANLHIGRLGLQDDFVKVLDFGLVKSIGTREQPAQTLATREGHTPGTPDFMPPGDGDGRDRRRPGRPLRPRLRRLVPAHRPVFEAANSYHVIARHLNDAPERPSRHTTRQIPPILEEIVLACLAKKPGDRPASAAALSLALARVA